VVPQPGGVGQRVERDGVLLGAGDAEEGGGGAGADDEVVERQLGGAVVDDGDGAVPVDGGDRALPEVDVGVATHDAAHGVGDVGSVQAGGGHLVQQRQERVEVVAVDDGDVDIGLAPEAAGHGEAPEAGSDDDDTFHPPILGAVVVAMCQVLPPERVAVGTWGTSR
jgi:hypothetical protein